MRSPLRGVFSLCALIGAWATVALVVPPAAPVLAETAPNGPELGVNFTTGGV